MPFKDSAINRDFFAGFDHDDVANLDFIDGDDDLLAVLNHESGFWRQPHQFFDGFGCFAFRNGLKRFTE